MGGPGSGRSGWRPEKRKPEKGYVAITKREEVVLRYLAQGFENSEIAEAMNITKNTLRSHLSEIYYKLDIKNRGRLIIYAYRMFGG